MGFRLSVEPIGATFGNIPPHDEVPWHIESSL